MNNTGYWVRATLTNDRVLMFGGHGTLTRQQASNTALRLREAFDVSLIQLYRHSTLIYCETVLDYTDADRKLQAPKDSPSMAALRAEVAAQNVTP